ncbi:MAG TPA: hypothetical protein VHI73_00100 [Solirubrobacteraceae bacterium]|nr:hypothetical protein [Solirubrobacteraceae bacterium]
MTPHDQPQQHRRTEDPPGPRDDRRKRVTDPSRSPSPSNPPVERVVVARGRDKLERVLS